MDIVAACKASFTVFAELVWKHLHLPPLTPRQKEVCWWLQYGPKRNQTWAFRGMGKSYLTGAYACWVLFVNPDEAVLVLSASKKRADEFVQFTRRLIEDMDILQHLKPDPRKGQRDSTVAFDVGPAIPKQAPSVKALGITGQLAGARGSTIILDDVEVPNNSATPDQREKLATQVQEVDAILLPDDERTRVEGKVRVLGTPQSMETIYAVLEERGYVPRIWPVQYPDADTLLGYRGHMEPNLQRHLDEGLASPGDPTEPTRFGVTEIEERRLSYGALGFSLQFMLSTALADSERFPLKTKDLIVADFPIDKARELYVHSNHPDLRMRDVENLGMTGDGFYRASDALGAWTPFESTVLAVDPSGKGRDETAICGGSQLGGTIFLQSMLGSLDGYSQTTLEMIALEARRLKAQRILVEANYGGGMFSQLLRPVLRKIYPCTIEEVTHSVSKERRIIDTCSPVLEQHKVVCHPSVIERDAKTHAADSERRARDRKFFYQLTHLTDERGCLPHDDRLDAFAMLVAYFTRFMSLDGQEESRLRAEQRWREWEDAPFEDPAGDSWIHHDDPTSILTDFR